MSKSRGVGLVVIFGAAAMAAIVGSGVASAQEEFVGQTYAEAQQAIAKAGLNSRIGTTMGGDLPTDKCIVSGSRTVEVLGASGMTGGSEIVLDLNCTLSAASEMTQGQPTEGIQNPAADAQQSEEQSMLDQQATPGLAGE